MEEEIIKVKPCPFCGGKVDVKSRYIKGVANRKHYWIECTQCRASQCKDGYRTIGKAVARWNKRPIIEERNEGHWINDTNYSGWTCTNCGYHDGNAVYNYCPNCGAKMKGE